MLCAGTCECPEHMFASDRQCEEKKGAEEVCRGLGQCREPAICSSDSLGTCRCPMDTIAKQGEALPSFDMWFGLVWFGVIFFLCLFLVCGFCCFCLWVFFWEGEGGGWF